MSKPLKAKFSILCDIIFLVRLQEKFELITVGNERANTWRGGGGGLPYKKVRNAR